MIYEIRKSGVSICQPRTQKVFACHKIIVRWPGLVPNYSPLGGTGPPPGYFLLEIIEIICPLGGTGPPPGYFLGIIEIICPLRGRGNRSAAIVFKYVKHDFLYRIHTRIHTV